MSALEVVEIIKKELLRLKIEDIHGVVEILKIGQARRDARIEM